MNKHSNKWLSLAITSAIITAGIPASIGIAQSTTQPGAFAQPASTQSAATQPATTQPAPQPTTRVGGVTRQDGGFLLNFQDVSIDVILNELSETAGLIVVKEVKPEGRVTLVSKQPMNSEEAVSLLNTVLRNAGYAAIKQERILKIVAKDSAKRLNIPVRTGSDPSKIAKTDELITQVISLRYADATQLKTDLQPLINSEADFASNASSNALVITDTSANVRRVVEIVAALDTSVADSVDVKVFQLKYSNAIGAARLINEVFGNIDASRSGAQSGQGNQGNQGGNRGGGGGGPGGFGGGGFGGGGFGGGGGGGGGQNFRNFFQQMQGQQQGNNTTRTGKKVNAGADERTNSLVVTGPPDTLEIVAQVVKELDANPAVDETVYVYHLRNSQAANIEGVLNSLFNGTAPPSRATQSNADVLRSARTSSNSSSSSRSSRAGSNGGGGFGTNANNNRNFGGQQNQGGNRISQATQDLASGLGDQVSIIADTDSNSLIVRTSPSNYDRVKQILEDLDKPVAQVLIKVLIAEVTHDNGSDIGVEISALNSRATGALGQTTAGQVGGTNFNIPTFGASATGLVVQILENNFTATIRALETSGKLDVLSRPYILASDNQLASITVGQEVPFITNSRITDNGETINTIEYSDIGILLDVIPHINPDGLVILDVAPEISTLTGTTVPISDTIAAPVIAKRAAQSRVGVRNGQTIVIGGLMEDRVTKSVSKVPLLGDLPWLGALFRRTQESKSKTELLIFLTPHVAAAPEVLGRISKDEMQGTKLVPNAVEPGVFQEHREGLNRGAEPQPSEQPPQNPLQNPLQE